VVLILCDAVVEWSLSLIRRHEGKWDRQFMGRNSAVWELVLRPYADMILPWLDSVAFTADPPVVPFFEVAMKGELDTAALDTIAKFKTAFGPEQKWSGCAHLWTNQTDRECLTRKGRGP
jgi:hypothetical protein